MSLKIIGNLMPKSIVFGAFALIITSCEDGNSMREATENMSSIASEQQGNDNKTAAVLARSDGDVDMAEVLKTGPLKEMEMGDKNAPVTIVEYLSLTCSHCADFHNNTFKEIKSNYIDTGKVRFIMREFPFDPRAAAGIMLARCAPEDRFFSMVDVLFQQQSNWSRAEDTQGALLKIARLAGFSEQDLTSCLTNQKLLDDVTAVRDRGRNDYGVQSTPTFIINGKRYPGNMPLNTMSALIESYL